MNCYRPKYNKITITVNRVITFNKPFQTEVLDQILLLVYNIYRLGPNCNSYRNVLY